MRHRLVPAVAAWVVATASLVGCGAPVGPSDTLRSYARALEDKRVEDAYALLSDEARRALSLDAFRRMVLESPDDVSEVARSLARPTTPPEILSTVTLANGEELQLVLEDGAWKVNAAAVDLYGQSTPRQALVGFLRAVERGRFDVLLRYVPDEERLGGIGAATATAPPAADGPEATTPSPTAPASNELTAEGLKKALLGPQKDELMRVLQAVRAALPTATIEEHGDTASMSFGSNGTVSLIRERGMWKVRDF